MKIKNPKVVIFSLIAFGFIALTFLVSPYFIIGAIILMLLNQRELMKSRTQGPASPKTENKIKK